jgi:hypothetical protein
MYEGDFNDEGCLLPGSAIFSYPSGFEIVNDKELTKKFIRAPKLNKLTEHNE